MASTSNTEDYTGRIEKVLYQALLKIEDPSGTRIPPKVRKDIISHAVNKILEDYGKEK